MLITEPNTRPREHWWKLGRLRAHDAIAATVLYLDDIQAARRVGYLKNLRTYTNRNVTDFTGSGYASAQNLHSKIRLNATKSVVDTVVAHIATVQHRPLYLTVDGDYQLKERAKNLGRFMVGTYQGLDLWVDQLSIFRDSAVFGPGRMTFYEHPQEPGKIVADRLFPDEIVYDEDEACRGHLRTAFRVKEVSKAWLAEVYPKKRNAILAAPQLRDYNHTNMGTTDLCTVIEAWHLPSYKGAKDGRKVLCVAGATIYDGPYTRTRFPWSTFNLDDPVLGIEGLSLVEAAAPIQLEINYISQKIQRLMTLATSFVWKERGSGVGRLINKDFAQYEYTGKPPIFQTVSSVSSEYFAHLDRLYNRMFELVGVSQMAATARKPEGLESGEAIRTYADIGSKRWQHVGRRWQHFQAVATARRIYDLACEIKKEGRSKALRALFSDDQEIKDIPFNDAFLEENKFRLRAHPVNLLPDTPEGKLALVEKLAQTFPYMQPDLAELLSGHPDVESVISKVNASRNLTKKMVHTILSEGKPQTPHPSMNLEEARVYATQELMLAYRDNIPPEKTRLLGNFISRVDQLMEKRDAEMQGLPIGPGAPGPQPGAIAGAPGPGGPTPVPPTLTNMVPAA